MATIDNRLDQKLDIAGSQNQAENLVQSEEVLQLGSRIAGQLGFSASIINSGVTTISGLSGMTDQSVGHFLTLFGANSSINNGTFLITLFNSSTSVDIVNVSAVNDLNNGSISWLERASYSLEDDLNYIRTDRSDIKGVDYFAPVPTYTRPSDITAQIPANLSNIAGKTTDARSLVNTRKFEGVGPIVGNNFIHLFQAGQFPYANTVNRLGLPLHDHADSLNDNACYCDIIDPEDGAALNTISDGYKIFGFSRQGSSGVNGDSFEVELRYMQDDQSFAQSLPYIWETDQPSIVDIYFPFRESFADMDETALRTMVVHGVISGLSFKPTQVGQFLYAVESSDLKFTPQLPVVNDQGFILVNAQGIVVVT
jgi:hypothetical protein